MFCKSDSWRGEGKHITREGEAVPPPTQGPQGPWCLHGMGPCFKIKEAEASKFLVTSGEGAMTAGVHSQYTR